MKKEFGDHDQRSGGEVGVGASAPVSADLKLRTLALADTISRGSQLCLYRGTRPLAIAANEKELIVTSLNSHADMLAALTELAGVFERMAALHPSRDLREVLPDPSGLAIRTRVVVAKAEGQS